MKLSKFKEINFTYTDASEERAYAPEIIDKAFVDINQIIDKSLEPNIFIVYGPKGSGKTALASKLMMMSESRYNWFIKADELEDFEFNLLKKTGGLRGTGIGGAISVWKLLLYLSLTALICQNEKVILLTRNLINFKTELEKYGLLASSSLINIVQETSKRGLYSKFKQPLIDFQASIGSERIASPKDPAGLVSAIEYVLQLTPKTDSLYLLILDGLDYPLRGGRDNIPFLVDLISATRQVNSFFGNIGVRAKILLLARNEILYIIPDPNLAKRMNDNGVELEWYDNVRSPFDTELLKVIERRANLVGIEDNIRELWRAWFPEDIGRIPSIQFVLDNTRHLPRDLISYFRCIQKIKKDPPFNEDNVFSALIEYSKWFRQELNDAIVGLIPEGIRTSLDGILAELGREFSVAQFSSILKDYDPSGSISAENILKELFSTSWIGNKWKEPSGFKYAWKHRNRTNTFSPRKICIVHRGLWKVLNLHYVK